MSNTRSASILFLILVCLIIVIGAVLRLSLFDLMEFKADEVKALLMTKYWLSHGIPQFGLMSGVGIRNPPGFIFILLPAVLFTSSPLTVGLYMVTFNVAALWLIYRLGVILGSPRSGLWAGAYLAVHPWLILYSRKIWAQSLLPFFILLLLLVIARCSQQSRSRLIFWVGPLLSLTWQIHYSCYSALLFFIIWFSVKAVRKRINWRWAASGLVIGLVILSPYFYYSVRTDFVDFQYSYQEIGGGGGDLIGIIPSLVKVWAETSFAGGFGYPFTCKTISLSLTPLGAMKPWLQPLAVVSTFFVIILAVLGLCLRERKSAANSRFELWLALFALLPLLLYLFRGREVLPHYYIIGLPALLMLAGLGTEKSWVLLRERGRTSRIFSYLPYFGGLAIIICGMVIWLSFILYINRVGGTAGDYGVAYRYQAAVAETFAAEKVPPEAVDAGLTRDNSIGIYYLLECIFKSKSSYAHRRERLVDSMLFPDWRCSPGEICVPIHGGGPLKRYLMAVNEKTVR